MVGIQIVVDVVRGFSEVAAIAVRPGGLGSCIDGALPASVNIHREGFPTPVPGWLRKAPTRRRAPAERSPDSIGVRPGHPARRVNIGQIVPACAIDNNVVPRDYGAVVARSVTHVDARWRVAVNLNIRDMVNWTARRYGVNRL